MTFKQWYTERGFLYHRIDKQDLRDIWQAAQQAERERAKELVDALQEIKEWGHLYSYSGQLVTKAGIALLKYEEDNNVKNSN